MRNLAFTMTMAAAAIALPRAMAVDAGSQAAASFLMDGIRSARQQVYSGMVEIELDYEVKQERFRIQFDHRIGTYFESSPNSKRLILRTDSSTSYFSGAENHSINIYSPNKVSPTLGYQVPDMYSLGLLAPTEWRRGLAMKDFFERFDLQRLVAIEEAENKLIYQFDNPAGSVITTLTVDPLQAFSLTALTADFFRTGEHASIRHDEMAITWTKISECYVPSSVVYRSDRVKGSSMNCVWTSVNSDASMEVSRTEEMPVPNGTMLVDHRLGDQPVMVGRIGERIRPPVSRTLLQRSTLNARYILVLLAAAMLGTFVFAHNRQRDGRTPIR